MTDESQSMRCLITARTRQKTNQTSQWEFCSIWRWSSSVTVTCSILMSTRLPLCTGNNNKVLFFCSLCSLAGPLNFCTIYFVSDSASCNKPASPVGWFVKENMELHVSWRLCTPVTLKKSFLFVMLLFRSDLGVFMLSFIRQMVEHNHLCLRDSTSNFLQHIPSKWFWRLCWNVE